jgi:hypothetical protein
VHIEMINVKSQGTTIVSKHMSRGEATQTSRISQLTSKVFLHRCRPGKPGTQGTSNIYPGRSFFRILISFSFSLSGPVPVPVPFFFESSFPALDVPAKPSPAGSSLTRRPVAPGKVEVDSWSESASNRWIVDLRRRLAGRGVEGDPLSGFSKFKAEVGIVALARSCSPAGMKVCLLSGGRRG